MLKIINKGGELQDGCNQHVQYLSGRGFETPKLVSGRVAEARTLVFDASWAREDNL